MNTRHILLAYHGIGRKPTAVGGSFGNSHASCCHLGIRNAAQAGWLEKKCPSVSQLPHETAVTTARPTCWALQLWGSTATKEGGHWGRRSPFWTAAFSRGSQRRPTLALFILSISVYYEDNNPGQPYRAVERLVEIMTCFESFF